MQEGKAGGQKTKKKLALKKVLVSRGVDFLPLENQGSIRQGKGKKEGKIPVRGARRKGRFPISH